MNKQRKVVITTTYNEMGIIIDTKVEEVAQQNLQPTCNQLATDTISRQAAIDALCSVCNALGGGHNCDKTKFVYNAPFDEQVILCPEHYALTMLPSVQPEREKGEWVYNSPVTMKCNRCGLVIKDWDWHRFKICPNCGADMRGGENDGCSQVFEREESDV